MGGIVESMIAHAQREVGRRPREEKWAPELGRAGPFHSFSWLVDPFDGVLPPQDCLTAPGRDSLPFFVPVYFSRITVFEHRALKFLLFDYQARNRINKYMSHNLFINNVSSCVSCIFFN